MSHVRRYSDYSLTIISKYNHFEINLIANNGVLRFSIYLKSYRNIPQQIPTINYLPSMKNSKCVLDPIILVGMFLGQCGHYSYFSSVVI